MLDPKVNKVLRDHPDLQDSENQVHLALWDLLGIPEHMVSNMLHTTPLFYLSTHSQRCKALKVS